VLDGGVGVGVDERERERGRERVGSRAGICDARRHVHDDVDEERCATSESVETKTPMWAPPLFKSAALRVGGCSE
jgi:hypothetical protein